MSKKIRIGRIDFANVWPMFYRFPMDKFSEQVEMIPAVPTTLNKGMADGTIDMGPISSFAYGEHHKDYVVYPNLSVSSWGPVNSIFLFHKKPLEEIAKGRIALPTTSATSVNLLKILLAKYYGGAPDYHYAAPVLADMMKDSDAALLIGDHAIKEGWNAKDYQVTDLGKLWNKHTGHWMTFAVWAVRRQAIEQNSQLVEEVYQAFLDSKHQVSEDPSGMIKEASRSIGGPEAYWQGYFSGLCHDFDREQWDGLLLYYRYAFELGLLDEPVTLNLWQPNSVMQVNE